jgi:hypothetical protein
MQCNAMQCKTMQCNARPCKAMQYHEMQSDLCVPGYHATPSLLHSLISCHTHPRRHSTAHGVTPPLMTSLHHS